MSLYTYGMERMAMNERTLLITVFVQGEILPFAGDQKLEIRRGAQGHNRYCLEAEWGLVEITLCKGKEYKRK